MVEKVKVVKLVKGDYTVIRVSVSKRILKVAKVKCLIMDTTVNKVIMDCLTKYVKGFKQHIDDMKAKG